MNLKNKLLFTNDDPVALGLGYHNIGSGVLRYSNEELKKRVGKLYSQRCGHIPLNANTIGILVDELDDDIQSQVAYLSNLYGKEIKLLTLSDVKKLKIKPLIVPFISVPEAEKELAAYAPTIWGIPSKMTHVLKNKSEFYRLVNSIKVDGFTVPEYATTYLTEVIPYTKTFLKKIVALYTDAGLQKVYPVGVMIRAADEDGNNGCTLLYEKGKYIVLVPNGEIESAKVYGNWDEALVNAKSILAASMHIKKEPRVVVTRYIDKFDSPGMSVVILNGSVFSLGWNDQQQKEPTRYPIAAGTYRPKDAARKQLQKDYEQHTAEVFEKFLRETAERCKIDFDTIQGIANIDIIIPTELEKELQKKRGQKTSFYYSECNPRWTTYTDAIMTVLGAQKKEQTVNNMLQVIQNGIAVVDRYKLPKHVEPRLVRELIHKKDKELQTNGTRLICRMATNPFGVIFAGDIELAQSEMRNIVREVSQQSFQATPKYLIA